MVNWKTTLFGTLAALPQLLPGLGIHVTGTAATVIGLIGGVGAVLFGYFAKDKNVTGGTVHQ